MMKKRITSLVLAMVMCLSLSVSAFAAEPLDTETLPPWVEDGEQWFPADGIMPLEDFGNCPKGHEGPSGYTYQGYTTGRSTGHFDSISEILSIVSSVSSNEITVKATDLGSKFFNWLHEHENPNLTYFKYVYTKGSQRWTHVIYSENVTSSPRYVYITCETFYN